jgi:hypothetical protein
MLAALLAACSGTHGAIGGSYKTESPYERRETLNLSNGTFFRCGGVSCRDGTYKYCDADRHCETGSYHFEARTETESDTLDVVQFSGDKFKEKHGDSAWVEYDSFSGEPMLGFGDPDESPEFVKGV